jgi:glycosyltransferase involved in cell wall biosynthesis
MTKPTAERVSAIVEPVLDERLDWAREVAVDPLITVVIAAHNVEDFLGATMASVLAQTMPELALVVVLDRCSDGSLDIARRFAAADLRLQIIEAEAGGVSAARNIGLEAVNSPYVLFLDGDDLLAPDALDAYLRAFRANPEAVAVVGAHSKIDEAGVLIEGETAADRPAFGATDALGQLLARNTIVNGGAIAIRTAAARAAGGFDPRIAIAEDWDFWCRLALLSDFATLGQRPVLLYRQRRRSAFSQHGLASADLDAKAIDKVFNLPEVEARVPPRQRARLQRNAAIDYFWATARAALYGGNKQRFVQLFLIGLWRFPDSLLKGFLVRYLWRKSLARLGVVAS